MEPQDSTIPKFRADGYLPEGLYLSSEAEVMFRFGSSSWRRRRLVFKQGIESALELEEMILTRRPEEIFAAEDETDWNGDRLDSREIKMSQ